MKWAACGNELPSAREEAAAEQPGEGVSCHEILDTNLFTSPG